MTGIAKVISRDNQVFLKRPKFELAKKIFFQVKGETIFPKAGTACVLDAPATTDKFTKRVLISQQLSMMHYVIIDSR